MTKFFSLFVAAMLFTVMAFAQNRLVTGKVADKNGDAIPFATVTVKGSNTGAAADANGNFSMRVKNSDILLISGSGINTLEVPVGSQTIINTTVERSSGQLEQVVVTALGQRTKAASIGYSVSSVRAAELTQAKTVNIANGLTGKVSGLNIQTVNSGVTGDVRITLRAIRSLTGNNQPLLVLDGVPVALNQINQLSPNDVADVSILKSNSAAALYGQDGANGAILVTTKRGTRGKPTITIGTTIQFEKLSFLPKLQHEYGTGETEDANGLPKYDFFTNNSYGPRYDGSMVKLGAPLQDGRQQMVKYADLGNDKYNFFNTGQTTQNDVSISAGDEKSRFYLSGQDALVKGTIPNDKNRRTSFRFNAGREFGKLSASFSTNYTLQNTSVVFQNRGGFDDIYNSVIKTGGFIPLTSYKDWRNNPYATPDGYFNYFGYNPYMLLDIDRDNAKRTNLIASTDLVYKFATNFSLTYRLGTTVSNLTQKQYTGAITFSPYKTALSGQQSNNASVSDLSQNTTRISSDLFLNYNKSLGKFTIDGLLGNSVIQREGKSERISASNLVIPTLFNVNNGTGIPVVNEFNYKLRTVGYFGKLAIGFDKKIYVEATGRRDQDSRLPLAKNSFFYPSGNASIVLTEIFAGLKNSPNVNLIKFRGGISKSGNVNLGTTVGEFEGAYKLAPTFNVGAGFPFASLPGYTVGNTIVDPNIRPEFVLNKEIGVDLAFFKNRVGLEVTAFRQTNTDQVITVSLPTSTGLTGSTLNAASFINEGLEFDLKLTPLVNLGKFRFDLKSNLSLSRSKVTSIFQDLQEATIGNLNTIVVGQPAYILKLTDFARDEQGRVIVDRATGSPSAAAAPKNFGKTLPTAIFGFSPTLSVGGLTLTAVIERRSGNFVYNDIGGDLVFNGAAAQTTRYNRQPFVFPNSVVDDGTGKFVPNTTVTTSSGNANFWATSLYAGNVQSLYYGSADFWKLRELSLSYNFPQEILAKQKLFKAISITISGRNLLLFVPKANEYTDPEFTNSDGSSNATGVNTTGQTPPTRVFGTTFNFTF